MVFWSIPILIPTFLFMTWILTQLKF
jgi:hypothetical protein